MDFIFWWMPLIWPVIIVLAVLVVFLRRRRSAGPSSARAIAHRGRFTSLPSYRSALARYRGLLAGFSVASVLLLVGAVTLAARPASEQVISPEMHNRDIVLCLDVSGSMTTYDSELIGVFGDLAKEFEGERISLVVFNASAVTYFPLTSDYDYIAAQFAEIQKQFTSDDTSYFDGTFFGDGSSLVGDGLAACTLRFDSAGTDRSRSIILATDNLVIGAPIYTLPEAGALALDKRIRVYGINPGDTGAKEYLESLATEFKQVVTSTGGGYYAVDDPAAISGIVDSITAQQVTVMRGAPQLVETDRPGPGVLLAFLGLASLLLLAWRLRR